jgi:tryptophan 2,3-dioxygenase
MIGRRDGTGGTSGAGWLAAVAEERIFPELWEIGSAT